MKHFQFRLQSILFLVGALPLLIAGALVNYGWFVLGLCALSMMASRLMNREGRRRRVEVALISISSLIVCGVVYWLAEGRKLVMVDNMAIAEIALPGKIIITTFFALLGSIAASGTYWISRVIRHRYLISPGASESPHP